MSEATVAFVAALAGLAGALIGASAVLVAQWLANKHERDMQRRRELVDLVSNFWNACDRLWRAEESLTYAIMSLSNAEASGSSAVAVYEARRQESMSRRHQAETDGLFQLAQMRVLHPSIAEPAAELHEACGQNFEHEQRAAIREERQAAFGAYEEAARELLDTAQEAERESRRIWREISRWLKPRVGK